MTVSHNGVRIPTSQLDKSLAEYGITGDRSLTLSIKPPSDYVCPVIVCIAEYETPKLEPPHCYILVRGDVTGKANGLEPLEGNLLTHLSQSQTTTVRQLKAELVREDSYDGNDPATTTLWWVRQTCLSVAKEISRRGLMTCDAGSEGTT
jgi:hypothetical protein